MLLIKNGKIKTMVSPDLENGCVLIGEDGKILSVGENIAESAPKNAPSATVTQIPRMTD